MDLDGVFEDGEAELMRDLEGSTAEDVTMRTRLLENEIRVLRDESNRLALDLQSDKERVKENMEKIKMNKQLPYLVGNVVEILDLKPEVRQTGRVEKSPDRYERRAGTPRNIFRSGFAPQRKISSTTHARSLTHARLLDLHLPPNAKTGGGGGGGRRQRRPRLAATGQSRGAQDHHQADHLSARHRPGRRRCARFFFSRSAFPFVLPSATRRDVRRACLTRNPPETRSCVRARARRLIRRMRKQTR